MILVLKSKRQLTNVQVVANIWEGGQPLQSCTPDLDVLRGIIFFGKVLG